MLLKEGCIGMPGKHTEVKLYKACIALVKQLFEGHELFLPVNGERSGAGLDL